MEELVAETVQRQINLVIDANRWQLTKGLNNEGEWLPKYQDDPYFKTLAQAKGYEKYKRSKSPNRMKPSDVMDFYINGYTHDHIKATVSGVDLQIWNTTPWADEIDQKTDNKALGLSPDTAIELYNEEIGPLVTEKIKDLTGTI